MGTKQRTPAQVEASFWERVDRRDESECWNWRGGVNGHGKITRYGIVWFNGVKHKTHRFSWEIANGPIPHGKIVCHKCDNTTCVNPSHLFIGSHKDNALDCRDKGRLHRECGEDRYNATLTEQNIRDIRSRYRPRDKANSGLALAKEFGVGRTMIGAIIHRRRWKHVL